MKRVLVIEDNKSLAYGLKNNLEIEGYSVAVAVDGTSGVESVQIENPDLVILDLMLPDFDGFRVLKTLRESDNDVPVLILTARADEADKVRGLRLGGDDYVTKPFSILELLARVEALLRRSDHTNLELTGVKHQFSDVEVRVDERTVTRAGQSVALSPKEFDLLLALIAKKGAVVSRADLMQKVWGYPSDVLTRTVDTHILELRKKLEPDPSVPQFILTVRKTGYRFAVGPGG